MKKLKVLILTGILFIMISNSAFSANELFRSIATGNWNANSSWEMSTNGGGSWIPATSTPRDTSGTITIRNPNTVTVTVSTTANQLVLDSGGVLAVSTGIILTVPDGSGNDITMSQGSTLNGPGTVRTQGDVAINLRPGSAYNAVLNVNTGITYAYDQASPYDGSIYGNVTVDAGATLNCGNISGRSLSMYGSVINNGTITASSSGGAYGIHGPSLVNNGTLTCAGSVYFDSITSVSGNGLFTPAVTLVSGNVTLLSNITYSPSNYISMSSGGVLNPNGNTFTLTSGNMGLDVGAEISSPGTIRTQNTVSFDIRPGSAFNANLIVNTGTALAYSFASPYDGSIYGNVTVDAGATLNCGNVSSRSLTMFGSVINNGTITASSTGGAYVINGPSLVNNGTMTCAGTVYFDSITSVSGNGLFTPSATLVSGNVTMLSNITYSPSSYISMSSGGVLNPNGNTFTLTSGNMGLDAGAEISSPGTIRTQNTVSFDIRAGSAFNANLIVNTGIADAYSFVSPYDGSIYGNVTVDAGALLNCGNATGKSLSMFGSVINNGTLTATSTGGSMRLKGSSIVNNGTVNSAGSLFFDTTTSLSGSGSFTSHATLNTNANITLNSTHQMHSVGISAGAVFNISNQWLKLTASNPIIQNGTFNNAGSKIEYNGTVLQSVSVTNINYYTLRINNPAGATLPGNISIPDTLAVIFGDLNLNGKIITITPAGYMTETTGNVVFGTTGYITTTRNIGSPSSLNVAGMGAILTSAVNLGVTEIKRGHTVQTGLNGGTSIKRYYDITPTVNTGLNATLVYKFDDTELNGKPEPSLKLFKSTNSGSTWLFMGGNVNIATNSITITGLTSFSRWSADSSKVSAAIGLIQEGFYNIATNNLNMTDTVRAYLRNATTPYAIIDSAKGLLDSLTFKSGLQFSNAATGSYYIQLKHRNSLETWSKNPVNYIQDSTLNYDFTFAATQAYGNNEIQKGIKFCLYSGDVTQNGFIDLTDVILCDIASSNFVTGYVSTDVNGNSAVDLTDVLITYNNSINFVVRKTPLNP
ncbi:MAG: hypothetical protein IPL53_03805 [Ignavibacteria bacterium]|nr:hypothetical protein [Ignavibacteria bacterium]